MTSPDGKLPYLQFSREALSAGVSGSPDVESTSLRCLLTPDDARASQTAISV